MEADAMTGKEVVNLINELRNLGVPNDKIPDIIIRTETTEPAKIVAANQSQQ